MSPLRVKHGCAVVVFLYVCVCLYLHQSSDGTERSLSLQLIFVRHTHGVPDVTSLHLQLHQTVSVPCAVLHEINEQAQTLQPHTHNEINLI